MANKVKGVQVQCTIPPELNTILEEHKWSVRKTKAEVIKQAIEEYAARNNLYPQPEKTGTENVV